LKQTISQAEFATLDRIACAADNVHRALESFFGVPDLSHEGMYAAQGHLVAAIVSHLAIDDWDRNKLSLVSDFVNHRQPSNVDDLLHSLGVVAPDSPAPNP